MLQLENITKSFGGVKALRGVTLDVRAGEIHALLGENGAGKSTLMKVISGAHQPDSGSIVMNGETIVHNDPHTAQRHGISIIYQEFSLVPGLSVAENIYLGKNTSKWMQWQKINQQASGLIQSLGFEIDVTRQVSALSVAEQQVVEIAKALTTDVRLLILDEPSAVLGTQEVQKLFSLLRNLRDNGVAIIYISHHLDELQTLSDRITVLKDGKTVATIQTGTADKDQLVNLMIGRELSQMYPPKPATRLFDEQIEISDLASKNASTPLSFAVRRGEILGIGGLVGAGRTEALENLFGLHGKVGTRISTGCYTYQPSSPRKAIQQGWGMVPEDRKRYGGLLSLSIAQNISIANLAQVSNRWGFIDPRKEEQVTRTLIDRLQVKLGAKDDPLSSLSGGNQQKVILAKWLNRDLKVLLIDEPTRGVDVGARAGIYRIIQDLADQGVYVLMVSSDMEELMGLSDRILVLRDGRLQGVLERADFTEENILKLAIAST